MPSAKYFDVTPVQALDLQLVTKLRRPFMQEIEGNNGRVPTRKQLESSTLVSSLEF